MAEEFNTEGMLDMYLFENGQLLERLQEIVLEQKDEECFDEDSINEIFRTMHTIKGSSGIMMFDDITAVSHKLEDVFFYLRESHPEHVPHLELVEHVLAVADFITNEPVLGTLSDVQPSGLYYERGRGTGRVHPGHGLQSGAGAGFLSHPLYPVLCDVLYRPGSQNNGKGLCAHRSP